jgi:hypothetical protein
MKKKLDENIKTFSYFSKKSWLAGDENHIRVAGKIQKIISGENETLNVKEILHGNPYQNFKLVFTDTIASYQYRRVGRHRYCASFFQS